MEILHTEGTNQGFALAMASRWSVPLASAPTWGWSQQGHPIFLLFFTHQSHGFRIVQSLIHFELSHLAHWVQSLGFGIPQSLTPFELNPMAPLISVPCLWDYSTPYILWDQSLAPFKLNPFVPQSLGPFTLNSMVLGLLNPFIPQVSVSPHNLSSACSHMTWKKLP